MNNDFKKAGYFSAIAIFIIGIAALVISTAASYFAYDAAIILVGQFVSLLSFLGLLIIGVLSKHKYNSACVRFAEYILKIRKKDAERDAFDAQRAKEIQNLQTAAAQERENAVAAALELGRSEGAAKAVQAAQVNPIPQFKPRMMPAPVEPYPSYVQQISPSDEVLYNEYGEPVMIRRRVKKQRTAQNANVPYDRFGTPASVPTPAPVQTAAPVPAPMPVQTAAPVPTPMPVQTAAPVPTPMPVQTAAPVPTPMPVQTAAPVPTPMPVQTAAPVPAPMPVQTTAPVSFSGENQIYAPQATNINSIYAAEASNNQIYVPEPDKKTAEESSTPRPINVDPYRIDL